MINILAVFIGGGLGAALRYLVCSLFGKFCSLAYPFHTLGINILGSFILVFLIFYINSKNGFNQNLKLFLTVGFCGGFTTFSTFSVEAFNLLKTGQIMSFSSYLFLSVFVCILATAMGAYFAKLI